jgi:hypothetical protein
MIDLDEFYEKEIKEKCEITKITIESVDFVSDDSYQYLFFIKIQEGEYLTLVIL